MYYQFLQERSREVERAREAATRTARGFEGMTVVAGFYIQRYSPTLVFGTVSFCRQMRIIGNVCNNSEVFTFLILYSSSTVE